MNEPSDAQRNGSRRWPVAIIVPLVIVVAVIISTLVFSVRERQSLARSISG
jgi:hypothetical protein